MSNKKRILLVEDDPNFGIILRDFLKMNEYDVILAKNGMEGFEKFKKFEFNLCILDVMMPYKDGFTLATEIKAISPDMPIIFLTAKSMKEDVLKGYKVGADDYLKKPFDSDVLLFKIKAILKRNKHFSLPTAPPVCPAVESSGDVPRKPQESMKIIATQQNV